MTNNLRDEIARREKICEAATPGRWHVMETGFGRKAGPPTVYACNDDLNYVAKCADFFCAHEPPNNLNCAAFIAHARTGYPETLAALADAAAALESIAGLDKAVRTGGLQELARAALAQIAGRLGGGA